MGCCSSNVGSSNSEDDRMSKLSKKIIMYPTKLKYPEDGRRVITLVSNSKYLCKIEQTRHLINKDSYITLLLKDDCVDKTKLREAIEYIRLNYQCENAIEELCKRLKL